MRRIGSVLLVTAATALAAPAPATGPVSPAQSAAAFQSPQASRAPMLAAARAGKRLVSVGDYGTVAAASYSALLVVAGMADNVLKPLMLGRGVDAPMPVVLLGALGGMAATGILGMFVGATLLALGYQIFMGWVAASDELGGVAVGEGSAGVAAGDRLGPEPAQDDAPPAA